jgi:hypothetical protein
MTPSGPSWVDIPQRSNPRRCLLECAQGNRSSSKHSCLRTYLDNQNRTTTRQQPFVRDPPVHSRLLPAASPMASNPKQPPGLMLGNMREQGVRGLAVYYLNHACGHHAVVSADDYPATRAKRRCK